MYVLDKFKSKTDGLVAVRVGKKSTLLMSNEDMNYVIIIVEPLEKSSLTIDDATETLKHEIRKQRSAIGIMMAMNLSMTELLSVLVLFCSEK